MIKDYFIEKIENALLKAVSENKLGQMKEYTKGSLVVEKPKNPDFGDFAVNVSSLARTAKIAPPMIANAIVSEIAEDGNEYSVIGGFINFNFWQTRLMKSSKNAKISGVRKKLRKKKFFLNTFQQTRQALSTLVMADGLQWVQLWQTF